jgi:hypothetical protein
MKNLKLYALSMIVPALLLAGCGSVSDSKSDANVHLRMQAASSTNTAAKFAAQSTQSDSLVITEVKFFVEEMEIESVQNDSLDFERENFIVNLPLDGMPLDIANLDIPAGIYDEFEIEIEKPDDKDVVVTDTDFKDETGDYSVVVKGTFNGEAFMFRSSEDFEIEIELNSPINLGDDESAVLMISVDVMSWFLGATGEVLDPKNPANTERINENIEASFEAFEDQFDND